MRYLLVFVLLLSALRAYQECNQKQFDLWLDLHGFRQTLVDSQDQNFDCWIKNCQATNQLDEKNLQSNHSIMVNMRAMKCDMVGSLPKIYKQDQTTQTIQQPANRSLANLNYYGDGDIIFESFDWTLTGMGYVTPAKNQGLCGCCWAFVTIGMVEFHFAYSNQTKYDLSEEQVLQCTGVNDTCSGGFMNDALNLINTTRGAILQQNAPYAAATFTTANSKPSTLNCSATAGFTKLSTAVTYAAYSNMTGNYSAVRNLLVNGAVGALIYADAGFMSYTSGVYACNTTVNSSMLNHGVLIVGYDANGNWKVKNSYGTDWGLNGFAYIHKINNCGLLINVFQMSFEVVISCVIWLSVLLLS